MKEQLQKRLQELKTEYASGQKVIAELEAKQAALQSTLFRIQGAIQVLEEELAKAEEITSSQPTGLPENPLSETPLPNTTSEFLIDGLVTSEVSN